MTRKMRKKQKLRRRGVMFTEQRKAGRRDCSGRRMREEMGLRAFYETCPFFFKKKVLLDIFMFVRFNLGLASWKMHEE